MPENVSGGVLLQQGHLILISDSKIVIRTPSCTVSSWNENTFAGMEVWENIIIFPLDYSLSKHNDLRNFWKDWEKMF